MLEKAIVTAPSSAHWRSRPATQCISPASPIDGVLAGRVRMADLMSQLPPVRERCRTILSQNWREGVRDTDGVPYAYTCPSPGHYPWQWYWDSCFTATSWRHFDPERSRRELESLLAAQRE